MGLGPIFLRRPLISYMLLHNKLPQAFQLKQQVPSQSVCGSRIGGQFSQIFCFWVFHRAHSRRWPRLGSPLRLSWGRICFYAQMAVKGFSSLQAVGLRAQLLASCCLEDSPLPPFSPYVGLPTGRLTSSKPARESLLAKGNLTVLCNIIMKGISHHFCLLLLIRNNPHGAHTQEQDIAQEFEYQDSGKIREHLRVCL